MNFVQNIFKQPNVFERPIQSAMSAIIAQLVKEKRNAVAASTGLDSSIASAYYAQLAEVCQLATPWVQSAACAVELGSFQISQETRSKIIGNIFESIDCSQQLQIKLCVLENQVLHDHPIASPIPGFLMRASRKLEGDCQLMSIDDYWAKQRGTAGQECDLKRLREWKDADILEADCLPNGENTPEFYVQLFKRVFAKTLKSAEESVRQLNDFLKGAKNISDGQIIALCMLCPGIAWGKSCAYIIQEFRENLSKHKDKDNDKDKDKYSNTAHELDAAVAGFLCEVNNAKTIVKLKAKDRQMQETLEQVLSQIEQLAHCGKQKLRRSKSRVQERIQLQIEKLEELRKSCTDKANELRAKLEQGIKDKQPKDTSRNMLKAIKDYEQSAELAASKISVLEKAKLQMQINEDNNHMNTVLQEINNEFQANIPQLQEINEKIIDFAQNNKEIQQEYENFNHLAGTATSDQELDKEFEQICKQVQLEEQAKEKPKKSLKRKFDPNQQDEEAAKLDEVSKMMVLE